MKSVKNPMQAGRFESIPPSGGWRACMVCALMLLAAAPVRADPQEAIPKPAYLLGVFPHLTAARLEKIFAPIAADMSAVVGRRVLIRTRTTYAAFSEELRKQRYDIALLQPFDYVQVREAYSMIPLARRAAPLSAVFVVNEAVPIYSLADLRGKELALPPETAAVSHLAKAALVHAGLMPGKDVILHYQRSHDACLQQLLIRRVDACGTADYPLRFFKEKMNIPFQELARSPTIPHVLFAVHPRVVERDREAIKQSILSWLDRDAGRRILSNGRLQPFVAASDEEYEIVRTYWREIKDQTE